MAESQFGVGAAKIFNLDGTAYAVGGANVTVTIDDASLAYDHEKIEDKGQAGDVETLVCWNETLSLDMTFKPKGANRAAAVTALASSRPAMGAKVTIAGCAAAAFNGDYNYDGGWAPKMTKDGLLVTGIKLKAYVTNRAAIAAAALA